MKIIYGLCILGCASMLGGCHSTPTRTEAIAAVRSGAIMLRGALQAVRENQATIDEVLMVAKQAFPPGSDLAELDSDARAVVDVIHTSTDAEVLAAAARALLAKTASVGK